MHDSRTPDVVAHASIAAPRDLAQMGVKRLDVHLQAIGNGRYRWFHADGKATVVAGASIDEAVDVARLVWNDFDLGPMPGAERAAGR